MKVLAYLASAACFGLGLLFVLAAFHPQANTLGRLLIGGVLCGLGWLIIHLVKMRPVVQQVEIKHSLDAPGDLKLQEMRCRQCAGTLGKENITVAEGGISVTCPYCGSTYQMEEAPKW